MEPTIPLNPANEPEKVKTSRTRIPVSLPLGKVGVPEVPGYHLHWMRGEQSRLQRALAGGYTFVEQDEVQLNGIGLADSAADHGSTDMGSRVSVISGGDTHAGQPERLYLMKIKEEFWNEDQAALLDRNESIAAAIRGDRGLVQTGGDNSNRYVPRDAGNKNLFIPKHRRP